MKKQYLVLAFTLLLPMISVCHAKDLSSCKSGPDLVITKMAARKSADGTKVMVTYTLKNKGNAKAGVSRSKLEVSDKKGAIYDSAPSLMPGSSVSRTVEYFVPEKGNFDIKATADYNNLLPEKNEMNNENSVRFSVGKSF